MQEAEKPQVVLVLHSIGWHLHDCIITFISPAGENGKELCKQCGCSGRFVNARTLWLTENYCCTAARWVTIGTCVFCWSAKCQLRFVYNFTPQTVKKTLNFQLVKLIPLPTLGRKSAIYQKIHILKISFWQNSQFQNLNFHKKSHFQSLNFPKFTFFKH